MTVIVYKAGVLVCDSGSLVGDTKYKVKKYQVFQEEKTVLVGTGTLSKCLEMFDWFTSKREPKEFPSIPDNMYSTMILFNSRGVFEYGGSAYPIEHDSPYIAWGGGREAALGAMHAGACAIQAALAACTHINGCEPPLHVFTFDKNTGNLLPRQIIEG